MKWVLAAACVIVIVVVMLVARRVSQNPQYDDGVQGPIAAESTDDRDMPEAFPQTRERERVVHVPRDENGVILRSEIQLMPRVARILRGQEVLSRTIGLSGVLTDFEPRPGDVFEIAGHSSLLFTTEHGSEYVFAPVLGVELRASGIRKRTRRAEVLGYDLLTLVEGPMLVAGFTGEDSLAVAVDGAEFDVGTSGELTCALLLSDGSSIRATLDTKARGLHRIDMPLALPDLCSVIVRPMCLAGCSTSGIEVTTWPVIKPFGERPRTKNFTYAWGSLAIAEGMQPVRQKIDEDGAIDGLATGATYGVGLICSVHDRYGRRFFVAQQGQPIDVHMDERIRLECRVTPKTITSLQLDMRFLESDQSTNSPSWLEDRAVAVTGGLVLLSLPTQISMLESHPYPLPRFLRIKATAPTCDPVTLLLDVQQGAGGVEAQLDFECRSDLRLSTEGFAVKPEDLSYVMYLAKEGHQVEAVVQGALLEGEDMLVKLDARRTWPSASSDSPPADIIVLAFGVTGNYDAFAFSRADNVYRLVPARDETLVLDVQRAPEGATHPWYGWSWRGIDAPCDRILGEQVGERITIPLRTPDDVESFWWSSGLLGRYRSRDGEPLFDSIPAREGNVLTIR